MPSFQPYWGKPAVRNDRGDRGDVGIIRSPVRARSGTIQRATKPTTRVVNATAPIASSRIPPRFLRKSAQAVKQAPSISRGGRNKTRTSFGGEARDKCQHNAAAISAAAGG